MNRDKKESLGNTLEIKMITENRLKHIIGVARKIKLLAEKIKPNDKKYAENMFVLGFLHDVGYEFGDNLTHAKIGGEILQRLGFCYSMEIADHGRNDLPFTSDELFILNWADMTTDSTGKDCTLEERLADIGNRYGSDSMQYRKAATTIQKIKSHPKHFA